MMPTMPARARAPPAAPPAIAATDIPLSGSEDGVASEGVTELLGVEVLEALDIVVEPPVAW